MDDSSISDDSVLTSTSQIKSVPKKGILKNKNISDLKVTFPPLTVESTIADEASNYNKYVFKE